MSKEIDIIRKLNLAEIATKQCVTCKKYLPLASYYFGREKTDPVGRKTCKICDHRAGKSTTSKTLRIVELEERVLELESMLSEADEKGVEQAKAIKSLSLIKQLLEVI